MDHGFEYLSENFANPKRLQRSAHTFKFSSRKTLIKALSKASFRFSTIVY